MRKVTLRDESKGRNSRSLWAYVDEGGLNIEGQDLGPGTASMSGDGEYEWFRRFAFEDVPLVVALLDGEPGEDVMDVLERWVGKSDELEARMRESTIPSAFSSYSG